MTYQSSAPPSRPARRTTHSRWPSTSKRAAAPTFTSSTEHTLTSLMTWPQMFSERCTRHIRVERSEYVGLRANSRAVLDLADDVVAEAADERTDGQTVEDVVEEAEDDEALRLGRRDAAALQVVELVLVDRADGAGVRALDVVGLDLEVRDRLGPRPLGEH